jgi:hypothetical protein
MHNRRRVSLVAASLLLFASVSNGADWPTWRGPGGLGITSETDLPLTWSATENGMSTLVNTVTSGVTLLLP